MRTPSWRLMKKRPVCHKVFSSVQVYTVEIKCKQRQKIVRNSFLKHTYTHTCVCENRTLKLATCPPSSGKYQTFSWLTYNGTDRTTHDSNLQQHTLEGGEQDSYEVNTNQMNICTNRVISGYIYLQKTLFIKRARYPEQ